MKDDMVIALVKAFSVLVATLSRDGLIGRHEYCKYLREIADDEADQNIAKMVRAIADGISDAGNPPASIN